MATVVQVSLLQLRFGLFDALLVAVRQRVVVL
jgi:hypothetical protein